MNQSKLDGDAVCTVCHNVTVFLYDQLDNMVQERLIPLIEKLCILYYHNCDARNITDIVENIMISYIQPFMKFEICQFVCHNETEIGNRKLFIHSLKFFTCSKKVCVSPFISGGSKFTDFFL